ncbi:transaldolase family protein [Streptomyces sp. NPDC057445]|uniref:transaldolase family protein n=1 Tax=Streptomyces sp. NPDC057445 TaxID=3346136 RepID=UPI0036B21B2D
MPASFQQRLTGEHVTLHLDGYERGMSASGELEHLVAAGVTGLSWHPGTVARAVRTGRAYGGQLRDLALLATPAGAAVRALLAHDGRLMCDALRQVAERTGGRDGYASLPPHPGRPGDPDAFLAEARVLHRAVDRPNLLVAVPALPGPSAARVISDCLADGIGVNATHVLAPAVCHDVTQAFLTGLERARAAGRDLSRIGAMVTLPLQLLADGVDSRPARRRCRPGRTAARTAARACARLGYQAYERALADPRWRSLVADGARPYRFVCSATYTLRCGAPAGGAAPLHDLAAPGTALAGDRRGLAVFLAARRLGPDCLAAGQATPGETLGIRLSRESERLVRRQSIALRTAWAGLRDAAAATTAAVSAPGSGTNSPA